MILTIKTKYRIFISAVTALVLAVLLLNFWVDFSFQGHLEGIYFLRGEGSKSLLVTDDVYLGEEERLISGIDFAWFHDLLQPHSDGNRPHLELEWSERGGYGYVRNYLGDNKILMTSFSRYIDSNNHYTKGLFIGGALPGALLAASKNNSGMSYFDGQRWSHIWCNTNEGIGSTISPAGFAPSDWRFLGSRIVSQTPEHVAVTSEHEISLDGVSLQIERTIEMIAGEPDLSLTVKISNTGHGIGRYFYYYGDEPWLGDFGSARGDVGWVDGRLVEYEEEIDPKTVDYAGMADYGSSVLGEGKDYGHAANFIKWLGPDKPDTVFFANRYKGFKRDSRVKVPLQGDGRSIGMYWGSRTLVPGEVQVIRLAIGMAAEDPVTGLPKIPTSGSVAHGSLAALSPHRKF